MLQSPQLSSLPWEVGAGGEWPAVSRWPCSWHHPPVASVAGACCQQGRHHYCEGSLDLFQPVLHLHQDSPAERRTGYIPSDFLHFPQPEEEEADEEEEFPEGGGWLHLVDRTLGEGICEFVLPLSPQKVKFHWKPKRIISLW